MHAGKWTRSMVALSCMSLIAACGGADTDDGSGAGQGTVTVRAAVLPIANMAPLQVAEEQGFFEDEGIKFEGRTVDQGSVALEALLGGSVDIAFPAHLEMLVAASQREGLRVIMGATELPLAPPDNSGFMVLKDSEIDSVDDLRGKTVAAGLLNSINHFYTTVWLEQNGVDPETVEFREVPFPNMADALKQGILDAAFQVEPFVTVMNAGGEFRNIAHPYLEVNPGFTSR
jgi:NitT/TauT family transport system substrate-binding protein